MENDGDICNTTLGLGIGSDEYTTNSTDRPKKKQIVCLDLCIDHLHPKIVRGGDTKMEDLSLKRDEGELSGDSSSRNNKCSPNNKDSDENDGTNNNGSSRKKLRLTKEQSTLLEQSFNIHNTLTPTEKQTLADKLNLRPRQVEVWFQNRRARTKLKQTEVDCEFLKKCCDSLSDENSRLKRELQELRMLKMVDHHSLRHNRPLPPPFYIQMPKAATLTMCPSCCGKSSKTSGGTTTIMALSTVSPPTPLPPTTTAAAAAAAAVTDLVQLSNNRKRSCSDDSSQSRKT